MEIDRELVERRLAEIKEAIKELEEIATLGLEEFLSKPYIRYAANCPSILEDRR